jgi:hypothetical protein
MTETTDTKIKAERKMTVNGFLKKASTANSALGFLSAHKEWMLSGELTSALQPILARIDDGSLMPTPALGEIQQAVIDHIGMVARAKLIKSNEKQIKRIEKELASQAEATVVDDGGEGEPDTKVWTFTIYDSNDEIMCRTKENGEIEELIRSFSRVSIGDRWADRALFAGASDWYGVCTHSVMNVRTIILRQDAIARVMHPGHSNTVMSKGNAKNATLSFRPKVKESRSVFSHG